MADTSTALRVLGALALVLGACGGGGAGDDVDQATTTTAVASPETTVQTTEPTATSEATENTGTSEDNSSAQSTTPDRSSGSLTAGGETYLFAVVDDGGSCDPDLFGIGFSASLTHVDEDGQPIEMADLPGSAEFLTVSLPFESGTGGVVGGNFGGTEWYAGEDDFEESTIDSYDIDGSRAEGTATFVTGDGDVVEGSFEVTCVEGSVRSSGSSGDLCDEFAESIVMDDELDLADPDIDRLLARDVALFDELRSRAPAEIADDMDILYESLVEIDDLFAEYDYDVGVIPDDEMQQLGNPEIQEAINHLIEYCG